LKGGSAWLAFEPFRDTPGSATLRDLGALADGRVVFTGSTWYGLIKTPDAWVEYWLVANQRDPPTVKARGCPFFAMLSPDCGQLQFSSFHPGVRAQVFAVQGSQVLIGGKALEKEDHHDIGIPPILKDALKKLHGGGTTDGFLMLVETGESDVPKQRLDF
jgi:hypothetical protein